MHISHVPPPYDHMGGGGTRKRRAKCASWCIHHLWNIVLCFSQAIRIVSLGELFFRYPKWYKWFHCTIMAVCGTVPCIPPPPNFHILWCYLRRPSSENEINAFMPSNTAFCVDQMLNRQFKSTTIKCAKVQVLMQSIVHQIRLITDI